MIKQLLRSIGLLLVSQGPSPDYNKDEYKKASEYSEAHRAFLEKLLDDEDKRLASFEAKTSQMIAQTGLVFSLLSLFVPLLIDKTVGIPFALKCICLFLLVVAFLLYMLTLKNALKNYKLKNYQYQSPSGNNVIKHQHNSIEKFHHEIVQDLLSSLTVNTRLNNIKATHLIQSYHSFKLANIFTGVLVITICSAILFSKESQSDNDGYCHGIQEGQLFNDQQENVIKEFEDSLLVNGQEKRDSISE
ncbi:hypothetical protein [Echinicola sp. 20G]|uniref:hypothetical protein n=1 Tax=Echinicola sp. 20G TaxID=2781961 RepID=UPI00190FC771|nr:hypothetical protein [Echinicola sp. 20G]